MIERASLSDLDEILYVINTSNFLAFSRAIPPGFLKYPFRTRDELAREIRDMIFFVYRLGGRIVGVAALYVTSPTEAWLCHLYVLPQFQRRGIGSALLKRVEQEALLLGVRVIRLMTPERAHWAIRFYRKHGYMIVARVRREAWFDVIMEKRIC